MHASTSATASSTPTASASASPAAATLDSPEAAIERARAQSLLSPRFYTTDFAAMDRLDLAPVRTEWDALMAEYEGDNNHDHFQRDEPFKREIRDLPPALRQEFLDFLVSSMTSEYSGCVLYNEIRRNVQNPDIKQLMTYMARDESRHASFINSALKDYGLGVDLGTLRRTKAVTYFKPKYILYATYLSEKIGYARYIAIFRQLERHPELRFHPIFRWFERWCNDEYRHGESFALIMRAHPRLLAGANRLWIRFFLLAVYATMFVRDHQRPEMHKALGLQAEAYDFEVFGITTACTRQVFPLSLDTDAPAFRAGLRRLVGLQARLDAARQRGGLRGRLAQAGCALQAAATFARLYLLPVQQHALPAQVRMAAQW